MGKSWGVDRPRMDPVDQIVVKEWHEAQRWRGSEAFSCQWEQQEGRPVPPLSRAPLFYGGDCKGIPPKSPKNFRFRNYIILPGGFKYVCFCPEPWGNDQICLAHIFQMGWFNHQLAMFWGFESPEVCGIIFGGGNWEVCNTHGYLGL